MPDFKVKDEVYVVSLKKLGTIAEKRRDEYDVFVGGLKIRCRKDDLKPRAELSRELLKTLSRIAKPVAGAAKQPQTDLLKIDLHGMRVEDAMRQVEKALDRALMEGISRVEVVHGIGAGKIRAALHQYLKELPTVANFRLDEHNAGVTWVYF